MEILKEIQDCIRDVLEDDDIVVTENTELKVFQSWDSMSKMQIMVSLEQRFQAVFTPAEIAGAKTVGDLVHLVELHGKRK